MPPTREQVWEWISRERARYADVKYDEDGENRHRLIVEMKQLGITEHSEWWVFITNYLKRAQLFGLDTPQGRQAFGKCIVTMLHCLETAVDAFGDLPMPGVPSGMIESWAP